MSQMSLFDVVRELSKPTASANPAADFQLRPTLRPYQKAAVASVLQCLREHRSTLLVMATGLGKTIAFSEIVRLWPGRSLILAHRRELLDQAQNKLRDATGEHAALEQGDHRAWTGSRIIVASKDSLHKKRLERFKDVSLLIIDEAHRAGKEANLSYSNVIKHLREDNPDMKMLGVTATPKRHDGEAMGQIFESVAYQYEIHAAIKDGWLVPLTTRCVHIEGLDLSNVRTTAGDLNGKDLNEVLERDKVLLAYADAIVREANIHKRKHVLVFCSSVAQAQALATMIDHHNAGRTEFVCGDAGITSQDRRIAVSRDFRDGRIRFLVNCGVYLEGFDAPLTDMIAIGRPTKSLSLFTQMIGRGSRPAPGIVDMHDTPDDRQHAIAVSEKPNCMILDFVGNSKRHKLATTADVLGGKYAEEVRERAARNIERKGGAASIEEELKKAEKEIEQEKQAKQRKKARITARANYSTEDVDVFDPYAQAAAYVRGLPAAGEQVARMPFGKHKGKAIKDCNSMYLKLLWQFCPLKKDWLRLAVSRELSRRNVDIPLGVNSKVKPASKLSEEAPF